MITFAIALTVGAGVGLALGLTHTYGYGWSAFFGVLAFVVSNAAAGMLLMNQRKSQFINQYVQDLYDQAVKEGAIVR